MSTEHSHRLSTSSASCISSTMSIDDIQILSTSSATSIATTMSIDDIQILSTSPALSTSTSSNTNRSSSSSLSNTNNSSSSSFSNNYCPPIAAQFRHYLENELPLDKKVKVFRWLYVGQTIQSPPYKSWRSYYKREATTQRTLTFAMCTLTERDVPHRLVVASSEGSENMEAVVAALLNIPVDSDGKESNAINRVVCGKEYFWHLPKIIDEQAFAILKFNHETEMIICVHCKTDISTYTAKIKSHRCAASGLKKKGGRKTAKVYARLFTRMDWCPTKDTCKACAVIVPRSVVFILVLIPQLTPHHLT
jgi:hypothetical protein